MAGDWIKMRTDLYRDPKIIVMADELMDADGILGQYIRQMTMADSNVTRNVMRNAVVGALVTVWGVARHQGCRVGDDLCIANVTGLAIDDIADLPGLGYAMIEVGWLRESDGNLVFPRFFTENNTDPRKSNAERQKRYRDRQRNVTRNVTRNDRDRVEIEKEKSKQEPPKSPKGEMTDCLQIVNLWNSNSKLKRVRKLTNARATKIRARLKDSEFPDLFAQAVNKLPHNKSGFDWQPDFDWLIRNDTNVLRIVEGSFDGNGKDLSADEVIRQRDQRLAETRALLAESKAYKERAGR